MEDKLINSMKESPVWFGEKVKNAIDLFSRKQAKVDTLDDKYFSQYWQVYAWAAIIGFHNNKREKECKLENRTSFDFKTILGGSETVANTLVLMAIGKSEADSVEKLLNPRELLTIISEYAEGGAKHIFELRESKEYSNFFDHPDDYLVEIHGRTNKSH